MIANIKFTKFSTAQNCTDHENPKKFQEKPRNR